MWHCRPQGLEQHSFLLAHLILAHSHLGLLALPSSLPRAQGAWKSAPGPLGQRDLWKEGQMLLKDLSAKGEYGGTKSKVRAIALATAAFYTHQAMSPRQGVSLKTGFMTNFQKSVCHMLDATKIW